MIPEATNEALIAAFRHSMGRTDLRSDWMSWEDGRSLGYAIRFEGSFHTQSQSAISVDVRCCGQRHACALSTSHNPARRRSRVTSDRQRGTCAPASLKV